jgi:hypothetical protein
MCGWGQGRFPRFGQSIGFAQCHHRLTPFTRGATRQSDRRAMPVSQARTRRPGPRPAKHPPPEPVSAGTDPSAQAPRRSAMACHRTQFTHEVVQRVTSGRTRLEQRLGASRRSRQSGGRRPACAVLPRASRRSSDNRSQGRGSVASSSSDGGVTMRAPVNRHRVAVLSGVLCAERVTRASRTRCLAVQKCATNAHRA